ncbi:MAG: mechanosensitive ion channel [Leptolyngbyaceae cyanobacterium MO_188.B28]|nr:mechanosensitive ion channel [Leptolyngbyaceae cyanobacterium MO_188.B28]
MPKNLAQLRSVKIRRIPAKAFRCFWIAVLILASLFWGGFSLITMANEQSPLAPQAEVVIDGRPIFRLSQSGSYTAQQRVDLVNRQLPRLANLNQELQVEVVERNEQPAIIVNDQYLLTVTEPDVPPGKTALKQAQEWAHQIELSLQRAQFERQPAYLKRAAGLSILALVIALVLHRGLGYFWRRSLGSFLQRIMQKITKRETPNAQNLQFFLGLELSLLRLAVWIASLAFISSQFPYLRQQRYDLLNNSIKNLIQFIQAPLFSLGERPYTVVDLLILLGLFWGLFALTQASVQFLKAQVLRRTRLDRGAQEIATKIFRYTILSLGSLILLQAWGIDLRSIALLGGALGIGIGFGLQDIAKNFASGLVLLFERSIQVGDFIEIEPYMGVVERIGARSITLQTLDHISVIVPNSRLVESQVVNWSHDKPVSRLHLAVGVSYDADPEIVKSALLQAAQEHSEVLLKPAPDVFFKGFGDNALEFDLLVWTQNPEGQFKIRSDLYFQIEKILKNNQISIPYPQRDLHLRTGQLPIKFAPDITEALIKAFKMIEARQSTYFNHSDNHSD